MSFVVVFIPHYLSINTITHIAFMSLVCNLYDITAAMQNNWGMFGVSLITRAAAAALFYSFGTDEWRRGAKYEMKTFAALTGAMAMSKWLDGGEANR